MEQRDLKKEKNTYTLANYKLNFMSLIPDLD